jgi:hypothetical protein
VDLFERSVNFFLFRFSGVFGFFLILIFLAFSCFLIGLLVFPLCGGALTFLCLPQRKVSKRKRLTPLILTCSPFVGREVARKRMIPRAANFSDKAISAPTPHYVRRGRVCIGNRGRPRAPREAIGFASAGRISLRETPLILCCSICAPISNTRPHSISNTNSK